MKNETLKDILVDRVKWRIEEIAKSVELINFDKVSESELNELLNHLDEISMNYLLILTRSFFR